MAILGLHPLNARARSVSLASRAGQGLERPTLTLKLPGRHAELDPHTSPHSGTAAALNSLGVEPTTDHVEVSASRRRVIDEHETGPKSQRYKDMRYMAQPAFRSSRSRVPEHVVAFRKSVP